MFQATVWLRRPALLACHVLQDESGESPERNSPRSLWRAKLRKTLNLVSGTMLQDLCNLLIEAKLPLALAVKE
jgi:hypothetical protein